MKGNDTQFFKLFTGVCKVINSSLDLNEVLNRITENVVRALRIKACTVFLWDREHNVLEVSATYGLSRAYKKKGPVAADKSISETLEGKKVLIEDAATDPRVQYPEAAVREGIVSILSVPISVKTRVIGVLRLYTAEARKFADNEYEFIYGLADMSGLAIDNARMYDHLKSDHEKLISDVHQWFEYGNMP